jgi:hypothetical protein
VGRDDGGLPPPVALERPIVLNANAFIPCNTLVFGWGDSAGIKLAETIDSYLVGVPAIAGLAGFADFRDHGVWLRKRRG